MLKPLYKNVLLADVIEENHDTSQIYMPSITKQFRVVNVGSEVDNVICGNIVIVNETKLTKLTWKNEIFYVINVEDILIVVGA